MMKKKLLLTILWIIIISVVLTLFCNLYMLSKTNNKIIDVSEVSKIESVDAILVLGCKAYSYGPSQMLEKRLNKGFEVYNLLDTKLLLSGDHGTKTYDEVNTMRDVMLNLGVDSKDIFLDHAGFSTYDSIYRAKYVFEAKRVVIITQKYHMTRALYLANELGLDAYGVVADDIPYKGIMLKNEIREILARDKDFFKVIFKPKSKYVGETISLLQDGNITEG